MPAPVLEPALDPVLDHERAHLAAARAQLARMRDSAASLDASRASDAVSGEALGATLARRVAALTDDPSTTLFFGRIDWRDPAAGDAARVEAGRVERRPSHVERVQRGRAIDEGRVTRRGGRGEEIGETRCVERR